MVLGDITNTIGATPGNLGDKVASSALPAKVEPRTLRPPRIVVPAAPPPVEPRTPRREAEAPRAETPRTARRDPREPQTPRSSASSAASGRRGPQSRYVFASEEDKVIWANALWDQRERQEALLEKVLEDREHLQELRHRKACAESRAAEHGQTLVQETDGSAVNLSTLSEKEAQLLVELEAQRSAGAPCDRTHGLLSVGVRAKETELERGREALESLRAAKVAKLKEGEVKAVRSAALSAAAAADRAALDVRAELLAQNVPIARSLHNGYLNLKGNIRVFCRFRPKLGSEADELTKVEYQDEHRVILHSQVQKNVTGLSEHSNCWDFGFDRVFGPSATQADVFEEISLLVQSALDGYKVAIFAYGQTGGGKTYTMDGPQAESSGQSHGRDQKGVIPRTVDLIFSEVQELRDKGWSFEVSVTMLEVYNDAVYDNLLPRRAADASSGGYAASSSSASSAADRGKDQRPAAGTDARLLVDQFTSRRVENAAAVHALLLRAARERRTAATACNDRSSRSHAVFQLSINGRRTDGGTHQEVSGLLSLVDLAGSERVEKSQVTGDRLKEAQHINKSLSALGDVVEALARRGAGGSSSSCHIPYRNSRLTLLLKDSLGGDSKALMFVNVSPCQQQLAETVSSLRFASKVHACKVGVAKRHAVDGSANKVPPGRT
mmetsp:Transcript_32066/g.51613  ORF Transcript_32066/g.51613 Transcript_32066/m.51613 type:complete len:668 (-) Transcript_32066:182-2185(-)